VFGTKKDFISAGLWEIETLLYGIFGLRVEVVGEFLVSWTEWFGVLIRKILAVFIIFWRHGFHSFEANRHGYLGQSGQAILYFEHHWRKFFFGKDRVDILESDSAEKKHKPHSKQTLLLSPSLSFLCFLML
jgi:hypothetical protein